jgi:pyruvate dehydrogenase E2 component (dihydrolipoamide acetyltransferase)/2-oxoglutarate dehydrogenase E2 component (dihydrolipoamide succinyltransferase)
VAALSESSSTSASEGVRDIYQGRRVKSVVPLVGMRKAIAEHMHRSLQVSAQLTRTGEIDVTELVSLREDLINRQAEIGSKITYTDLLVFFVAKVLKDYPMINASIIEDEIKVWQDINIGVAVSTEEGLIVPVVKGADKKSLVEISRAIKDLSHKARQRTLLRDEIQGGTFTISNLGARVAGWYFDTAIVNQPESAILLTGAISDRPVVRNGKILSRPIMTYSFTYDHRLIDGVLAGEFMAAVVAMLENPSRF